MLARAGKQLWPAFSTYPVAAHARRSDPPTVDLLVEVSDGLHISIDCIDAQADLQLVPRARVDPDKSGKITADLRTRPCKSSQFRRTRFALMQLSTNPAMRGRDGAAARCCAGRHTDRRIGRRPLGPRWALGVGAAAGFAAAIVAIGVLCRSGGEAEHAVTL